MLIFLTHRVAFFTRKLRDKKGGFRFHLMWCFPAFFLRWLRPRGVYTPKNGLSHFTHKCFAILLVLRPKKRGLPFHSVGVLQFLALAPSTQCICTKKIWLPISPRLCFAEQFPCSHVGVSYSLPPIYFNYRALSPLMGGLSLDRSDSQ